MGRHFVELCGATTVAADGQLAKPDINGLRVDLRAGVTDCGDQSSPIRIATGPGRFDQRRVRDRFGDADSLGSRSGTVDAQFDNMRDAFAIGDDLACKGRTDMLQRLRKWSVAWTHVCAAGSGGEQQHRVVCGGVSVNRDSVEAYFGSIAQIL